MNPRIREIAEQAEILFYQARINGYEYQGAEVTVEDLEKFAKLIVRECIQEIQNKSMNSSDEWEDGLVIAEYAIKEHFGVES